MEGGSIECEDVGLVADEDLLLDLCTTSPEHQPDILPRKEEDPPKGSS